MPVGNRLFRTPTVSLRNALGFTLKHAEKGDTPPRAKHSVQFCGAFARPPVFAVLERTARSIDPSRAIQGLCQRNIHCCCFV
jgi:hypothetical protein